MSLELLMHKMILTNKRSVSLAGIALALFCATTTVEAASVTLSWNPNSEADIAGYKIHYGRGSRTYPFVVDAGSATTQVIGHLQDGGSYFFAVTAYDHAGLESDFSGEISYTVPLRTISAVGDGSFRIRFQGAPERTYRIEYTESLTAPNWRTLGIHTAGANGLFEIIDRPIAGSPTGFYRSVYPAR